MTSLNHETCLTPGEKITKYCFKFLCRNFPHCATGNFKPVLFPCIIFNIRCLSNFHKDKLNAVWSIERTGHKAFCKNCSLCGLFHHFVGRIKNTRSPQFFSPFDVLFISGRTETNGKPHSIFPTTFFEGLLPCIGFHKESTMYETLLPTHE